MHERPIGDLTSAIGPILNGSVESCSPGDCPPVKITSRGWREGEIHVRGSISSQYLSGVMMAAPISGQATRIIVDGELVSRPYVEMTAEVMRSFGASVRSLGDQVENAMYEIAAGEYVGTDYDIEPDASAASYFWGAAAITQGTITVEGLSRDAMQGDVGFCEVLQQMGCDVNYQQHRITVAGRPLRGVDVDMNRISDTVQTFAVVALFASGPSRVRGVGHNRYKETDRIGDLACELRKFGAKVDEHEDGMTIFPPTDLTHFRGARLATYHDHRMAMSLSLAGLKLANIQIEDPACTVKTYPRFFYDLERLIGRSHVWHSDAAS
jgi:3-phosphoshikimate 1-carboxyvinyltransferase